MSKETIQRTYKVMAATPRAVSQSPCYTISLWAISCVRTFHGTSVYESDKRQRGGSGCVCERSSMPRRRLHTTRLHLLLPLARKRHVFTTCRACARLKSGGTASRCWALPSRSVPCLQCAASTRCFLSSPQPTCLHDAPACALVHAPRSTHVHCRAGST